MKKLILGILIAPLTIGLANSAVIFSGTDGSLDFDAAMGSSTVSGIRTTLVANTGTVNATMVGLGVNSPISPDGGDDTNGIDTTLGVETLSISFDVDVIFNSLTVVEVGVNDALDVSFNGVSAASITSSGLTTYDITLLAGDILEITATEPNSPNPNNGVTITQFTVTAVPEPSAITLVGLGALAIMLRRYR